MTESSKNEKKKDLIQRLNSPALLLVYDSIKGCATDKRCRISIRELSRMTNLAHATVQRAVKRLVADGILEMEQGRHPTEPATLILKEVDVSDRLVQARSVLDNIMEEIKVMDALLASLARYLEEIVNDASRFRKLRAAISSVTEITPECVQVILNVSQLDDDLKQLLHIE